MVTEFPETQMPLGEDLDGESRFQRFRKNMEARTCNLLN